VHTRKITAIYNNHGGLLVFFRFNKPVPKGEVKAVIAFKIFMVLRVVRSAYYPFGP
jgi:hypothetical protein